MREVLASFEAQIVSVTQQKDESITQLTQRVRRAVVYLRHHRVRLENALFVARPGFDLEDVPGTADLVRHLVSHMVEAGHGELHLQAANSDPRARYALLALADAIGDQVHGTGLRVVTHYPEPSQKVLVSEVSRVALVGKPAASA